MSVGSEDGVVLKPSSRTVVKMGYIKKLKTMKKKFFVLQTEIVGERSESWLEYYDNEKKFKNNSCSKRSISIRSCYVINRRADTKHKFVIGLHTRLDCFSLVFDSENDMLDWLRVFLSLRYGGELTADEIPKPYCDHAWRVTIRKKEELANCVNLSGSYLLCMTGTTLKFLKLPLDDSGEVKLNELQLQCIRRCGNLDALFYMELGQASCVGSGNLWMQTEDASIAEHMNSVILNTCTNLPNVPKNELLPKARFRSFSANESSKPISFSNQKWPSSGDDRFYSRQEQSTNSTGLGSASVCSSSMGDGLHPHIFVSYPPIRRASTGTRPVTCVPVINGSSGGRVNTSYAGRVRADSLPTKNRGTFVVVTDQRCLQNHNVKSNSRCSSFSSPNSTYIAAAAGCCPKHAISSNSVNVDNEYIESADNYGPIIIPEENNEEYTQRGGPVEKGINTHLSSCPLHKNGISDACSSHSSNPSCTNIGDRSNSQTSCSSCGSSPLDSGAVAAYSTSQGSSNDIRNDNFNRSFESVDHSRESSIHDEDGYMIMAPKLLDTGYNSIETNHPYGGDISPGLSSCSITSGTPSTDARLSEYHVRPVRAYSTGSKPEGHQTQMNRWDYDGFRVRAFSVGSHSLHQSTSNATSSSPIRTCNSNSTSSVEPGMVELDFSANKWRHKPTCLRRNSGAGATNKQTMEKFSNYAISSSSVSSFSSSSAGSGTGLMDTSPRSSPKGDYFVKDWPLSSASIHNKHQFGAGRSPPRNCCLSAFSKASPPTGISYLSPKLERVVERSSLSSRETTGVYHGCENIANKSNPELSGDVLDCGECADEAYMDMKPGVYKLDNNSSNCCTCYSGVEVLSSNSDFAANGITCRADEQQQIVFVPRPTGSKRSDGIVEYLDMSFGSSRQSGVDASISTAYSDSTVTEDGDKDDTITDEDESGGRRTKEDDRDNNETDQRQCSEPIAIVKGNDNKSVVGKRSSNTSAFFKRKSVCKHPSHQKLSFLALNIPIPSSFTPLSWKKKNSKKSGEKHDTSGSSSAASISSGSNHTIFPLSPESVPSAQPFKASEPKRTTSDKSVGTEPLLKVCPFHWSTSFSEQTYWSPPPPPPPPPLSSSSSAALSCTNTRSSLGNPEDSIYPVVIPAHVPKVQRKISEPSVAGKSNTKIRNVLKQDKTTSSVVPINPKKNLHRSTSVPDKVSSMAKSDDKVQDIDQRMSSLNLKNTRDCNGSADVPISLKQSNDDDDCYVSFAPINSGGSESKNDVSNAVPNVHRYEEIVHNNCEISEYATVGIMNDRSEYVEISFDKKKTFT